jgi:hypothetical protein
MFFEETVKAEKYIGVWRKELISSFVDDAHWAKREKQWDDLEHLYEAFQDRLTSHSDGYS